MTKPRRTMTHQMRGGVLFLAMFAVVAGAAVGHAAPCKVDGDVCKQSTSC